MQKQAILYEIFYDSQRSLKDNLSELKDFVTKKSMKKD